MKRELYDPDVVQLTFQERN